MILPLMTVTSSVAPGEGGTTPLQPVKTSKTKVSVIMVKNMRDLFIGNLLFIIYICFPIFLVSNSKKAKTPEVSPVG